MIPGVTAVGVYAISQIPSEYDDSEVDSLTLFLASPFGERIYLLEASPYDVDLAALASVRLSNRDYTTSPTDSLVSKLFKGMLITPYNVQASVFAGGRLATRSIPAYGESRIANPDGEIDALAAYSWAERALTIKAGLPTFRYDQFGIIFTGTAEGVTWTWNELSLRLRDYQYKLAKPLQPVLYGGFAGCVSLDGVDDTITGTVSCPAGNMTLQLLIWSTGNGSTSNPVVGGWENGAAAGMRLFYFTNQAETTLNFRVRNDAGTPYTATISSVPTGQFLRITGQLDTSALKVRLYIHTISTGTLLSAETAVTGTFNTTLTSFRIGNDAGGSGYYKGRVDDIRLYSISRAVADVAADARKELLGTETSLTYYNKLNEQTGTTATPTTGTGTLTLNGGAAWVGSLEGDATIAGKPKPKSYGQVRQVEPVVVDSLNLVFQWADGAVSAVNAVYDKGVALTGAGNVADLYATTVASGSFKTDNSKGLIRLGATPSGTLTLDGQGDASGSGYVYTAADIVRRIVSTSGGLVDPAGLDTASFSTVNTANSSVHGYHSRLDPVNIETALDALSSSVGAFWTYTRDGLFRLVQFVAPGIAAETLTDEDFVIDTIQRVTIPAPTKRIRLGYQKYWTTQEGDALAGGVTAADRERLRETYRYVTSDNTTISTAYLDAEETEATTLMDTVAAAQAEADRRRTLYGVERRLIHLRLVVGLFSYQLGDTIEFASSVTRYDLAGWKGVIVGIIEDVGDGSAAEVIEIDLWG